MVIVVTCDCGKTLRASDELAGKKGKCPACGRISVLAPSDATGPVPRLTLRGHKGVVTSLAFAPDGTMLASGSKMPLDAPPALGKLGEVKIWYVTTGRERISLLAHKDGVLSVAFSPDGETLVTGSKDHTVAIWDSGSGTKVHALRHFTGAVSSLAFSPDGKLLATASEDQAVRLWNTDDWSEAAVFETGRKGAGSVAFSPDGQTLAAVWCSQGPILFWDAIKRVPSRTLRSLPEHDLADFDLAFSPDGRTLAVPSANAVNLWNLPSSQIMFTFDLSGIRCMAYSPNGQYLAGGGWDVATKTSLRVWRAATGEELYNIGAHKEPVSAVTFSPDSRTLATASRDCSIKLWQLPRKASDSDSKQGL